MIYFLSIILCAFSLVNSNTINYDQLEKYQTEVQINSILTDDYLSEHFPLLQNSCSKKVLSQFLPACLKNGFEAISTNERVTYAIDLSYCEFEATGMHDYVYHCNGFTDSKLITECMLNTEVASQWWTTYSGHYQSLPTICFENSLPYEKFQILELFLNITKYYEKFSENIDITLNDILFNFSHSSIEHLNDINRKFKESSKIFNQTIKQERDSVMKDIMLVKSEIANISESQLTISNNITSNGFLVLDSLNNIQQKLSSISSELEDNDYDNAIGTIKQNNLEYLTQLREQSKDILSDNVIDIQNNHLMMTEILNSNLGSMSKFFELFSNTVNRAQIDLDDFDTNLQNTLSNSIYDIILPQTLDIQEEVLAEWFKLSSVFNDEINALSLSLNDHLNNINIKIDDTVEKIDTLNNYLTILERHFFRFTKIVSRISNIFFYVTQYTFRYFRWPTFISGYLVYFNYYGPISIIKIVSSKKVLYSSIKITLLMFAIMAGSKFGTFLFRYSTDNNINPYLPLEYNIDSGKL